MDGIHRGIAHDDVGSIPTTIPKLKGENMYKNYIKTAVQRMRPYVIGEDLTDVSVSVEDTPEVGGMIAIGKYREYFICCKPISLPGVLGLNLCGIRDTRYLYHPLSR